MATAVIAKTTFRPADRKVGRGKDARTVRTGVVKADSRWSSDDPVVKANPDMFLPADETVEVRKHESTRPKKKASPKKEA